jgi:hypothetical protein
MRILFAASGAYGHLYPVIPVARAAQRMGHTVAVADSPRSRLRGCHGPFPPRMARDPAFDVARYGREVAGLLDAATRRAAPPEGAQPAAPEKGSQE